MMEYVNDTKDAAAFQPASQGNLPHQAQHRYTLEIQQPKRSTTVATDSACQQNNLGGEKTTDLLASICFVTFMG